MRSRWLCLVVSTVATLSLVPAWSQDPKPGEQEPLNKRFEDPKLDVMSLRTTPSSVSTFGPLEPSPG